jgi:hypothetical protein
MEPDQKLNFCGLCGKTKTLDEFHRIPLAMLSTGVPFIYDVCNSCNTVVHNIRRIVGEADENAVKNEQILKKAKEEHRIITLTRPIRLS